MSDDEDAQELSNLLSRERRARLKLSDDEILVFYKAFKGIDENGDGRLQRSEIEGMLEQIGYEHNEAVLDKLFQEASGEGRRKGLDLPEFLDLMSLEKASRGGSIGSLVRSKIEEVLTYSSLKARELALRNKIEHKQQPDLDHWKMDSFIRSGLRCAQCRQMFDPDSNHDEACAYHPGPTSTHEAKENHLARVLFRCCARQQVGTTPALTKAKPCTTDWHRTREDVEEIFSGQRPTTAYHPPGTASLSQYAPASSLEPSLSGTGLAGARPGTSSPLRRPPTSSYAPSSPGSHRGTSIGGSVVGGASVSGASEFGGGGGGSARSSLSRPLTHGEARAAQAGVREFNKDVVAWQYEEEHRQALKTAKKDTPFDELVKKVAVAIYDKDIKLKKLFHKFDTNGNGSLEPAEFKGAMESVGYNLAPEQLMQMFAAFDIDHNGRIAFWEFVRSLGCSEDGVPFWGTSDSGGKDLEQLDATLTNDDLVRRIQVKVKETGKSTAIVWRTFDQSFRHTMDPLLYSKAMAQLGLGMAPGLCERLIKQYDQNGDGEQNEEEFNKMLESVETEEARQARLKAEAEARRLAEEEARRRAEEEARRREEEERRRREGELEAREAALRAQQDAEADEARRRQQEEEARRRARPTVGDDASDEEVLAGIVRALEAQGRPMSDGAVLMDKEARGSVDGAGMSQAMDQLGWNLSAGRAARLCAAHAPDPHARLPNPDLTRLLEAAQLALNGPPRTKLDDACSDDAIFRALVEGLEARGMPIPAVAGLVDPDSTGKMNGGGLQAALRELGADCGMGRCAQLVKDYTMDLSGQHMPTKAFVQLLQAQAKKLGIGGRGGAGGGGKATQQEVEVEEEKRMFAGARGELEAEKVMSRELLAQRFAHENDMIQRLREELFQKSRHMKSMFERMDLDNSYSINYKEFQHGLERAGVRCTEAEAMRMLARFDRDGNMRLDYNEFMRLLQNAHDIYVHDTGVKAVSELGGAHQAGRVWGSDGFN